MTHGAIVLCGGQSSRMGSPKALLPWRGRPMVVHIVSVLRECVAEIVVVSSAELSLPPLPENVKFVVDREPHRGPLAALRDGLDALSSELAFVTSVDAPFLTPRFVQTMLAFECAAVPYVNGQLQPLAAVYPKTLAATATELLQRPRAGLIDLLKEAKARRVGADELPGLRTLETFNTPEEYAEALKRSS